MLATLAVLVGLAVAGQTPNDSFSAAYADLVANVPPEKHHVTRYLSLVAYPELVRFQFVKVMTGGLNSTSWRAAIGQPVVVADAAGNPHLLRIDLEAFEWDYGARAVRLKELERRGVDFKFKSAQERNDILDPWEKFVRDDPYFFVTHEVGGHLTRGWIDPLTATAAWKLSKSTNFLLRADWLLSRMLTEKDFNGGYYSLLLMFSASERDLYRIFLVDIDAVDRAENKLRVGGAVLESQGVAHNNRELQLLNSGYGRPISYLWRTYDTDRDARGDQSVIDSPAGTMKHKGREVIGSLGNGWIWSYLCDGGNNKSDGKQVAVVPDSIATVEAPLTPSRDTRVIAGYSCFKCHPKAIREFDDVIIKAINNPTIALAVKYRDHQKAEAASIKAALADYYNSELGTTIKFQQALFESTVFRTCGLTGIQYATALVGFIEGYAKDRVDLQQAGREIGAGGPETIAYLRNAVDIKTERAGDPRPNAIATVLSTGEAQTRGTWEQTFGDVMRARIWPWESVVKPVAVPVQVQPAPAYAPPPGYRPR